MEQETLFYWYAIIVWRGKENTVIKRVEEELRKLEARKNSKVHLQQIKNLIKPKNEILRGIIYCEALLTPELVNFFYNIQGVISFLEHTRSSLFLPKHIDSEKIRELFKEEEKKKIKIDTLPKDLKIGDEVIINQGPFFSYKGKITRIHSRTGEVDVDLTFDGKEKLIDNILLERVPNQFCNKN